MLANMPPQMNPKVSNIFRESENANISGVSSNGGNARVDERFSINNLLVKKSGQPNQKQKN